MKYLGEWSVVGGVLAIGVGMACSSSQLASQGGAAPMASATGTAMAMPSASAVAAPAMPPLQLRPPPPQSVQLLGFRGCASFRDVGWACFEHDPKPQATSAPAGKGVVEVVGQSEFLCARYEDGRVACWGENRAGQLGDGTAESSNKPQFLSGLEHVVDISSQWMRTHAVLEDGKVVAWGCDLGQNCFLPELRTDDGHPSKPEPVEGVEGAVMISTGQTHQCALRFDGRVVCWGESSHGALGRADCGASQKPNVVEGIDRAVGVVAGWDLSCAWTESGRAWCWGDGSGGQLGDGTDGSGGPNGRGDCPASMMTARGRSTPVEVMGLSAVIQMGAGWRNACALVRTGNVVCWGDNEHGELGNGTVKDGKPFPQEVPGVSDVKELAMDLAGGVCARKANEEIWCWGSKFGTTPVEVKLKKMGKR